MKFVVRLLINAAALALTFWLVNGLCWDWNTNSIFTLLLLALVFGLVNAFIRPLVTLLTCPLVMLTLGLFTFVINALMLWLTVWLGKSLLGASFTCEPSFFWDYLIGAFVLSLVSWGVSLLVPDSWEGRGNPKKG